MSAHEEKCGTRVPNADSAFRDASRPVLPKQPASKRPHVGTRGAVPEGMHQRPAARPPPSDLVSMAKSTARWIRIDATLESGVAVLCVVGAVASFASIGHDPWFVLVGVLLLFGAGIPVVRAWLQFKIASRLRRGVLTGSASTFASAFAPLRWFVMFTALSNIGFCLLLLVAP